MDKKIIKCVFKTKREVSQGVKAFLFEPKEEISYKAGQFAFFEFEYKGNTYSKPFSFSGSPERENVEMTTMISGSNYKQALDAVEPGHEFLIKNIKGKFIMDDPSSDMIVFLSGGIGITPAKSMLEYAADKGKNLSVRVLYSNLKEERIAFRQELEGLQEKLGDLKVIHTLTDLSEEEKSSWDGETGFIDKEMINRYIVEPEKSVFYVSGPPGFNKSMEKILKEGMGVESDKVRREQFAGY